jgi:hypothetical protein
MNDNKRFKAVPGSRIAVVMLLLCCSFSALPARAAEGPLVIRPRMLVSLWQNSGVWSPTAKKMVWNTSSWVPSIKFRISGPVKAGSQFVVEFTKANGAPWFSVNCPTEEIAADRWIDVETPRNTSNEFDKKNITSTGVFGFKIRLNNEITNQNSVIYTGKYKVGRVSRFNGTPITKNAYDFYIDHDWALPFGYLWMENDGKTSLEASLWFRGQNLYNVAGYVTYKGNPIASTKDLGSAGDTELEARTIDNKKGDPGWSLMRFTWYRLTTLGADQEQRSDMFYLDKNPGEYEIKILRDGKLARTMTFTIGADGKIVDSGLGKVDKLNTARVVLPVKINGTADGVWNKQAWKTEAFYGNPVPGFVAAQ